MHIEKKKFENLLNSKFKIKFDQENEVEAELTMVREGTSIPSMGIDPYSLTFRAKPGEKVFAQGLYTLSSETIGEIQVFFVPRENSDEGVFYEVMFS